MSPCKSSSSKGLEFQLEIGQTPFFLHQNSIVYIVHVVNYNMSKFGFKILKLLNLKWKIASSITNLIFIAWHCTFAFHYPQWLPFQHALLLHSFLAFPWLVLFLIQSMKILYTIFMPIHHPTFSHSIFHVVTDCAEHNGAQVLILLHCLRYIFKIYLCFI